MGTLTVTIQNLEVVAVDVENNCILIKGNIPGPKKSLVIIKSAVKNEGKVNAKEELNSYKVAEPVVEAVEETVVENTEAAVEEN